MSDYIQSVISCDLNGSFDAEPYEEFVGPGSPDFLKMRMNFADLKGYRTEQLPNGAVRIFETDTDFAMRREKHKTPTPEHEPNPPTEPSSAPT